MRNNKNKIYLGIVSDGGTDHQIISELVTCLVGSIRMAEPIRLKSYDLHKEIRSFQRSLDSKIRGSESISLCSEWVQRFIQSFKTSLVQLYAEFQNTAIIDREITSSDVIILNTDTEKVVRRDGGITRETLPTLLMKSVNLAIESFYNEQERRSCDMSHIPMIVPMLTFPSTDYLVAAARIGSSGEKWQISGKKPKEVKKWLYGVDNLVELGKDDLEKKALAYLDRNGCRAIYKHIPEIRYQYRILSWMTESDPEIQI